MSKPNKRHKRGTDWSKLTDSKLVEIINNPNTQGYKGVDYGPYIEELKLEYYKRCEDRSAEAQHRFEQDQKQYLRHLNDINKSKKRIK